MDLSGIIFLNSFSQIVLLSFSIIQKNSPRKSPIKFMSREFKTISLKIFINFFIYFFVNVYQGFTDFKFRFCQVNGIVQPERMKAE